MMAAAGKERPVLIMAGGTGGHVFPALAVADELHTRGVSVSWLGTQRGLEARVVPAAGYPLDTISVSGLRGKGVLKLLTAPFMLLHALYQALRIELRLRPRAVLGMGGFAAGPGGLVAWLLRIPLLIHEQNSVAGTTNRLLAPLARVVMVAFPASFANRPAVEQTGNPVRSEIRKVIPPRERLARRTGALRVLVVGGSLGAHALNSALPGAVRQAGGNAAFEVYHQTGSNDVDMVRAAYRGAGVEARVEPFIEDMAAAYSWADLVVCRSGALTVAELAVTGAAAILVPYPHAIDDHQTGNARFLADAGAAVLVQQDELDEAKLAQLLGDFARERDMLVEMSCRAHELAMPDAARRVAELCLQAALPGGVA